MFSGNVAEKSLPAAALLLVEKNLNHMPKTDHRPCSHAEDHTQKFFLAHTLKTAHMLKTDPQDFFLAHTPKTAHMLKTDPRIPRETPSNSRPPNPHVAF